MSKEVLRVVYFRTLPTVLRSWGGKGGVVDLALEELNKSTIPKQYVMHPACLGQSFGIPLK